MRRLGVDDLESKMSAALARRGVSDEHTRYVVEGLIETSLRGIDTHGVRLFPTYLRELDGGRAIVRPSFRWHRSKGAAVRLDAGGALGLVAGRVATEQVVRDAKAHGIAIVAIGNSNHFGAASVYTLVMARAGLLGLAFSNSDALVAAHNGSRPLFGTNPLSFAVGTGPSSPPFCVDMATSQSSYSRVAATRRAGEPIASGIAVTEDGRDASELEAGDTSALSLLPLGGHKGQCLSMMVELLCTALTGAAFDHTLSHLYAPPYDTPRGIAHVLIGIDPSAFALARPAATTAQELVSAVNETRTDDPAVRVPGMIEADTEIERRRDGIPIEDEVFEALTEG